MKPEETNPDNSLARNPSQLPVVVTQGEATVKRAPDQAWLSIATETRDGKADKARRVSAESMTAVQAELYATGLSTDAIRTTGYSLSPDVEWKNGRSTLKGYIVRNEIEIRVDDLDHLGDVIDAANSSRNTTLTISGPRFALKNQQVIETEALRLALQTALSRAQALASGAGQTLGRIVRIEEQNLERVHRPEPYLMRAAMAKADESVETPITIGDLEVRVRVSLTAELL
jgi:hypothetical protein